MSNPFEDPTDDRGKVVSDAFGSATEEAKSSILREACDLAKAADHLNGQVKFAKKKGDHVWLAKLKAFAERLGSALVDFVKKAIELAIFKLVLELCAMIMNSIMTAITKTGNPRMEITTPGVYMHTPGQPQTQQATQQGNPFAGSFGNSSSVSPW